MSDKVSINEEGESSTNAKGEPLRRRPVHLRGGALMIMAFQTLGIIYSDIGTSPLYVLNGIWPSSGPAPSEEDVIGGLSAIVWSLTILPLIKYIFITLQFGTEEGEGGTFALMQGLYPKHVDDEDDRTLTNDSAKVATLQEGIRGQRLLRAAKWPLTIWSLFGTALTLSDGIFTPAVSVTSAVGGIAVAKPSVINDITPIAIAFLVALFLIQRFGTTKITNVFAPITFGWLSLIGACGIYNITQHPGVFRAIDPSRAVAWFKRTGDYDALAGVLLAITGCEAIFANLGQFNASSIQISFAGFVYPCLTLAYLGQGARLIVDGDAIMSNIFFLTIPGQKGGGLYWIVFTFAILATLIASQALITATFSLTQQLINMKSLPPLTMVYTSSLVQGQVYVPAVNYILGIATIIIVAVFRNLTNMTNAYGFAVATVMIVTSSLIAVQIYCIKKGPLFLAIGFFVIFVFFDGLFWGAALRKVPLGAWVPLMIGSILTCLMTFWTWARGLEEDFDGKNRKNPRSFLVSRPSSRTTGAHAQHDDIPLERFNVAELASRTLGFQGGVAEIIEKEEADLGLEGSSSKTIEEGANGGVRQRTAFSNLDKLAFVDDQTHAEMDVVRIPTCAVFHKLSAGRGVPHTFYAFTKQLPALPRLVIFLSVKVIPIAYVPLEDRYFVTKVRSIPGFYGVTYCVGFRDDFEPSTEEIVKLASELEARAQPENAIQVIRELKSVAARTSHIIPHYFVTSKDVTIGLFTPIINPIRRFLIESIYRRLMTMFPETANWSLDNENILRVGVNAPI